MSSVVVLSPEDLSSLVSRAVESGVRQAIAAVSTQKNALTEKEAGEYIRISPATLRTWRVRKIGPAYHKAGRSVLYLRSDLDEWLASGKLETMESLEAGHGR